MEAMEAEWRAAEAREQHMAMTAQWLIARRNKDYGTADDLRAKLRAQGVDPEQLAAEIDSYDLAAYTTGAKGANERKPQPTAEVAGLATEWLAARRGRDYETADRIRDELRGRGIEVAEVAAAEEAREWAGWKEEQGEEAPPAVAASAGHSSSLGQLLVMDYNVIKELPADLGMTVCSGQAWATADVLYAVKADEREKQRAKEERRQAAFDLKQTSGSDFPALESEGGSGGISWLTSPKTGGRAPPATPTTTSGARKGGGEAANLKLAAQWVQARRERDYATADKIRSQLRAMKLNPEELALQL